MEVNDLAAPGLLCLGAWNPKGLYLVATGHHSPSDIERLHEHLGRMLDLLDADPILGHDDGGQLAGAEG